MWPFSRTAKGEMPLKSQDVIWLNSEARIAGIVKELDRQLAAGVHVLAAAFTGRSIDALAAALAGGSREVDALTDPITPARLIERFNAYDRPTCILTSADSLVLPSGTPVVPVALNRELCLLVAERFPLREKDDSLLAFAAGLSSRTSVQFNVSLDDPLMRLFAGDRQAEMLRQLGAGPDEPLTHPFLARAIEKAQAHIAAKCPDPTRVESWIETQHRPS
ncbi:MAG: hypothetical protein KF678_06540 [Phycisphaeraceae bacterium]|nr:hypothetical protein [Phycisphaeraceae bacterium]